MTYTQNPTDKYNHQSPPSPYDLIAYKVPNLLIENV